MPPNLATVSDDVASKIFYCTGHTVMHRKVTSGGCISEVIRIVYHAGSD